jgi:hypothetical protein
MIDTRAIATAPGAPGYADDVEHLRDELARLDVLIQLRLASLDGQQALERDPKAQLARTIAIERAEVADLLGASEREQADGPPDLRARLATLSARIDARVAAALAAGVPLAMPRLRAAFGLTQFEAQAVLICLAPELRRRYDRLYAYLQDDISRKRPSVDLILDLLCESEPERWRARLAFSESGRLLRTGVLQLVNDPYSPSGSSGLAQFLRLEAGVLTFLLGDERPDPRLGGVAWLVVPPPAHAHSPREPELAPALLAGLSRLLGSARLAEAGDGARAGLVYLHGPAGAGRRQLALGACARLGLPALVADTPALASGEGGCASLVRLALREARLRAGLLVLRDLDRLPGDDLRAVLRLLADTGEQPAARVLATGALPWSDTDAPAGFWVTSIEVAAPDTDRQARIWARQLAGRDPNARQWAGDLAARYRLSAGRIAAAVQIADDHRLIRGPSAPLRLEDLRAACREISRRRLGALAVRVDPRYGWADLVLPERQIALLREICDQIRHQPQVLQAWGFGHRLQHGTGLSVLFSGQPGTGKTMAAQVLAGDLGLDLYTVDLSQVTSKYIGETEKNLGAVFAEAQTANAVLFFDEADALFGKRSEVSDAHDRYANLEISYLLQRMEQYSGVVVLATNLRQNLDEAFTRRIRFMVDFPFPDPEHRRRIWQAHFPAAAPVAAEVDVDLLARAFPLAGGSIKNVVLNAAFLAAANGGEIAPAHLMHGIRREFDKVGKVWTDPGPARPPTRSQWQPEATTSRSSDD